MLNKVTLIGNLGGDPDVRYMPNGNAVANLTIATSERWKDKQTGQQQEKTEWHRVVIFGKIAEVAGQYLKKGSKVFIEGKLQTREWEKDGVKRYTTEIVVDMGGRMLMLDGHSGQSQGGGQGQGQASPQPNYQQTAPAQQQQQQAAPAQQQAPQQAPAQQQAPAPQPQQNYDSFDDDIPF